MNDESRITGDELERYLDEQMSAAELELFRQRLAEDERAQRQLAQLVAQNEQLEFGLKQAFVAPEPTVSDVEAWLAAEPGDTAAGAADRKVELDRAQRSDSVQRGWIGSSRRSWLAAAIATAAMIAALLVIVNSLRPQTIEPFFQPRSLASIYQETVANGFQPYYLCDDPDRFASTFEKRQGCRLRLASLPPRRSMAGLSYLGGLSRETTAMLCFVEDQPVMVFVDLEAARQHVITSLADEQELFVHESTLGGLALFEVSSFAEPKMMEFLQLNNE